MHGYFQNDGCSDNTWFIALLFRCAEYITLFDTGINLFERNVAKSCTSLEALTCRWLHEYSANLSNIASADETGACGVPSRHINTIQYHRCVVLWRRYRSQSTSFGDVLLGRRVCRFHQSRCRQNHLQNECWLDALRHAFVRCPIVAGGRRPTQPRSACNQNHTFNVPHDWHRIGAWVRRL